MAIELSKQEKADVVPSIQRFFREELDQEISEMRAGFLLNYFLTEIAPIAYNKGVKDAESYFRAKIEDLSGTCFEEGSTYWLQKRKTERKTPPGMAGIRPKG